MLRCAPQLASNSRRKPRRPLLAPSVFCLLPQWLPSRQSRRPAPRVRPRSARRAQARKLPPCRRRTKGLSPLSRRKPKGERRRIPRRMPCRKPTSKRSRRQEGNPGEVVGRPQSGLGGGLPAGEGLRPLAGMRDAQFLADGSCDLCAGGLGQPGAHFGRQPQGLG